MKNLPPVDLRDLAEESKKSVVALSMAAAVVVGSLAFVAAYLLNDAFTQFLIRRKMSGGLLLTAFVPLLIDLALIGGSVLLVSSVSRLPRRYAVVIAGSVYVSVVVTMTVTEFVTGPSNLFPIALAFGAVLYLIFVLIGLGVSLLVISRRSSRAGSAGTRSSSTSSSRR